MSASYDLLAERWLPVRYADGHTADIAPHELAETAGEHGPPVDLAWPRPDFNGATVQLLIGLVQTTMAPRSRREWRRLFDAPPLSDEVEGAFRTVAPAFRLTLDERGGGFMQDPEDLDAKEANPAAWLLIGAPLDNTIKTNKDHFTHALDDLTLSLAEAAAALYTRQTFEPGVGAGYRKSVRGGGPLSTLPIGRTLWQTIWLSVLGPDDLAALGEPHGRPSPGGVPSDEWLAAVFPWLRDRPLTSGLDEPLTREDVDPLHAFWGMPNRVRLRIEGADDPRTARVTGFVAVPRGANYDGSWEHPLSPYSTTKENALVAQKGNGDRLSYKHWVGLATNRGAERPALVVRALARRAPHGWMFEGRPDPTRPSETVPRLDALRLWAYGFDMDNAKARMWVESRQIPVLLADPDVAPDAQEAFEETAAQLVEAADVLALELRSALRDAVLGRAKLERGRLRSVDVPKPLASATGSVLDQATRRFWTDSEPLFLEALDHARRAAGRGPDPDTGQNPDDALRDVRRGWLGRVRRLLLDEVFDDAATMASDLAPRVVARRRLELASNPRSPKAAAVCKALGLPAPPKKTSKKKTEGQPT